MLRLGVDLTQVFCTNPHPPNPYLNPKWNGCSAPPLTLRPPHPLHLTPTPNQAELEAMFGFFDRDGGGIEFGELQWASPHGL